MKRPRYTKEEYDLIDELGAQNKTPKEIVKACFDRFGHERQESTIERILKADKKDKLPSKAKDHLKRLNKNNFRISNETDHSDEIASMTEWINFTPKDKPLLKIGTSVEFLYGIRDFKPMIGRVEKIDEKGIHLSSVEGFYAATFDKIRSIKIPMRNI